MRAITYTEFGGAGVLRLSEIDEPPVGPDSVLVRARAAGVNPVDFKIRGGKLQSLIPAHFPVIPGWDVAGVIERVGPAVEQWKAGDEVLAYNRQDQVQWGTCAELVAAPLRSLARKPEGVSWVDAAALPLAGLTAYQCLHNALGIQRGETVLVHAASGGVGSLAVQIARALGAEVIGTAGEQNQAFLRSLGARALTYGEGLVERLRELQPNGVDAVLDLAGGESLAVSADVLRVGATGRIASVIDPEKVKELGGRYVFVSPNPEQLARLAGWLQSGEVAVELAATFPLADVASAHRMLEQGHVRGKLAITI